MELGPPVHPFIREFPIKSSSVPLTICYFLKQGRNSPPFGFSLMQWWERFTNDSAFNADNGLESLKRKMWQKQFFLCRSPWPQPGLVFLDILKMAIWNWILNIGVAGKYSSLGKSDSTERISIECNGIFGTSPVQYSEAVKYDATH